MTGLNIMLKPTCSAFNAVRFAWQEKSQYTAKEAEMQKDYQETLKATRNESSGKWMEKWMGNGWTICRRVALAWQAGD
jgi:hypothetical protein